jgi:LCP family protein required for cell wall assembly
MSPSRQPRVYGRAAGARGGYADHRRDAATPYRDRPEQAAGWYGYGADGAGPDGYTDAYADRAGWDAWDGVPGSEQVSTNPDYWDDSGPPDDAWGYGTRVQATAQVPGRAATGSGRRPRRTPRWAVATLVCGAVLALVSGGTAVASALLIDRYANNIQQDNLLGGAAAPPGEELTGPINILLLGTDGRQEKTDDVRSDTIIVLHVPSTHDLGYLISVPRDTWVSVPGYWEMKITEAFYHGNQEGGWTGGARLVAESLHQLTGLRFNAAAIVNFGGFQRIIDEMGGVEFCIDTPAYSEHLVLVDGKPVGIGKARREGLAYEPVRYEEGCRHLEGWQALDYARQRKTLESGEGDYGRQRHQQQLLKAMAERATSGDVLTDLGTLDRLIMAAGDALIIDTNGVDLVDFAWTLRRIRPGNLVSLRTNGGWFNSAEIEGQSAEKLDEVSLAMFRAAANDTMAAFVLEHPEVVNPDSGGPPANAGQDGAPPEDAGQETG